MVLLAARLIREGVLQQNAMSANDAFCSPEKQASLGRVALEIHQTAIDLTERGVPASVLEGFDYTSFLRAKDETAPDGADAVDEIGAALVAALRKLQR
jgi:V/A-type H+-transporting ATPase subunit A